MSFLDYSGTFPPGEKPLSSHLAKNPDYNSGTGHPAPNQIPARPHSGTAFLRLFGGLIISIFLCVSQVDPNQPTPRPSASPASRREPLYFLLGEALVCDGYLSRLASQRSSPLAHPTSRWDKGRPVLTAKLPPHPGTC